jgi:hypothetical protein
MVLLLYFIEREMINEPPPLFRKAGVGVFKILSPLPRRGERGG